MSSAGRLLILACSQRKRADRDLLPAIERYDGPPFRVLRKFLRNDSIVAQRLKIYVLSAEWGLIPSNEPIPFYDRRMTAQRADELRPVVLSTIRHILWNGTFQKLFVSAGKEYLCSLQGYEQHLPPDLQPTVATGMQGRRLSELHDWLYDGSPTPSRVPSVPAYRGKASIRGVEVTLEPDQVYDVARRAVARDPDGAARYQSWYVEVDGQRIAPKWLVSQLTGVPVAQFQSREARTFLQRLGVPVIQV